MRWTSLPITLLLVVAACGDATTETTLAPIPSLTNVPASTAPLTGSAATTTAPSVTTTSAATATTTAAPGEPLDTWIAVLASLPTSEYDAPAARSRAAELHTAAAVLLSDDYPSLNPGFWVVYLGTFEFDWEAEAACPDAVADCYTRYLAGIPLDTAIGFESGTVLAMTEVGEMVVLSATTGEWLRTVDPGAGGDGSFPGRLTLHPDGHAVYYPVGFEDFWFSCDASDGTLMETDLVSGDSRQIGDGFAPLLSPDGRYLLYLASSECIPDPNEEQFVLAPADTIVRRDLGTGAEQRVTVPLNGDVAGGYELWSTAWGPDDAVYVIDTAGVLWRHALTGDGGDWLEPGEPIADLSDETFVELVGYDTSTELLLYVGWVWSDDSLTTTLAGLDLTSQEIVTLQEFAGEAAIALDAAGTHLLIAHDGQLVTDDATVPVDARLLLVTW